MKKYNTLSIVLLICVTQLHAMENILLKGEDPSIPDKSGICFLVEMPLDVYKRIAYFLPWETKKQFIERVEKNRNDRLCYDESTKNDVTKLFVQINSADKSKKAMISLLSKEQPQNEITIFDHVHKQKIFNIIMPYNFY